MELLDENNLTVGLCKARSIDNQRIIFLCDDTLIKKARKARVLMGANEKSKTYIINRISELSYNSPNTEVRKAWLAVESIQLGSSDLSALIEPVEKLLFHIPQLGRRGRGGGVREMEEENQDDGTSEEEKKVPYGEFIAEFVGEKAKRGSLLISDSSALGLLTEFLLSRIGYRERKNSANVPSEPVSDIYEEEELIASSEGRETTVEVVKTKIKKKTEISSNQFDSQQRKLYKLADRYYEYLDDLLRERGEEELNPIEIVKYFVVMLLLTHFADKKIYIKGDGKRNKKVMFPLYDGWNCDFIYYGFGITSKFFSVAPKPIIERISFLVQFHGLPDDLVSAIAMGAYVLIVLILCSEKYRYGKVTDLEMSAIRLYLNAGVTKDTDQKGEARKLFEGFHNQAGFGNVIALNAIYKKHEELLQRAKEYERKVNNARKVFQEKREQLGRKEFRFPSVKEGDVVWNVRSGLGIVERIEENSRVVVSNPGYSHYDQDMKGYEEKKEHEIKIVQGYLIKIDPGNIKKKKR